jgi:phosphoglycerol transferase MdoB-like AlkP superfamily enzyme
MSARYRPLAALVAASLAVGSLLRTVLWWEFGTADGVGAGELPSVLARGLLNDLVVALYAFTPLALYLALASRRWLSSRAHRILIAVGSWGTLFGLVFLAVVERYFFQEFDARFNLVAFDYLAYPTEVVGDVWAEYPVVVTVLAAAVVASTALLGLRRWLQVPEPAEAAQ